MLALSRATVYTNPKGGALREATVLINGATIAAVGEHVEIPEGAKVVDCSGCTIVAGLWNSHVHFFERRWAGAQGMPPDELARQLEDFTRYGFTNVFDTGSMWANTREIRDRIESGTVPGPRIRSTGEAILPPGALPPDDVLRALGYMAFPAPEVTNEEEAAATVRQLLDAGVDGIKFFASAPRSHESLSRAVVETIVREAHAGGKPVFVHPNSGEDVETALRCGVDVIGHTTPVYGAWDEILLQRVASTNAALMPTLQLWKTLMRHDRISYQERLTEMAVEHLRTWREAGGTVLFGTDAAAADYDPTQEYALMAQSGMTLGDVLASLTTTPAMRFGDPDREGRILKGFNADLVVLNADPSYDIRALSNVRGTMRAGSWIYGGAG